MSKILGRLAVVAVVLGATFVAWLFWPQWTAPSADQLRWTVLESPAQAVRYRLGATRGNSTALIEPAPLRPGMALLPGEHVANPGPGSVRLRGPAGDVVELAELPHATYPLRFKAAGPRERLASLRGIVEAPLAGAAERPPFWRGVAAPEAAAFLLLTSFGLMLLRWRPDAVAKSLRWRQGLVAALVLWTLGLFLLAALGRGMSALSPYGGVLFPGTPPPRDQWAAVHGVAGPLASVVFLAGVVALAVLATSFVRGGTERLQARARAWWVAGAAMSMLILIGLGAPLLPVIDAHSNTEAWLRQFERFAAHGAGALIWPWLVLFVERSIPAPLTREGDPTTSFGYVPLAIAAVLATGLLFAKGLRDGELEDPLPRRTAAEEPAARARDLANAQRMACGATHVLYGTAHDFRVVREPGCRPHGDGLYRPDPGVLRRCEALEFRVAVEDQLWPVPAASGLTERTRTLRWTGVARPVEELVRELSLGRRTFDAQYRETTGPGPRVFYVRMDGDGILRNTRRGRLVTEEAPANGPRSAPLLLQACGREQRLAHEMRQACRWDVAFVGSFSGAVTAFPSTGGTQWEAPVVVDRVLDGDLSPGREWRVRARAGATEPGDPAEQRLADDAMAKRGTVVLARRDPAEPDLLHLIPRNASENETWFGSGQLSAQIHSAQMHLGHCRAARLEYLKAMER